MKKFLILVVVWLGLSSIACGLLDPTVSVTTRYSEVGLPTSTPKAVPTPIGMIKPPPRKAGHGPVPQQQDEDLAQRALGSLCGSSRPLEFDVADFYDVAKMFGCLRRVSAPCEIVVDGLKIRSWSGEIPLPEMVIEMYRRFGLDHRGEVIFIHYLDTGPGDLSFSAVRLGNEVFLTANFPKGSLEPALREMVAAKYCFEALGKSSQQCQEERGIELSNIDLVWIDCQE